MAMVALHRLRNIQNLSDKADKQPAKQAIKTRRKAIRLLEAYYRLNPRSPEENARILKELQGVLAYLTEEKT